MSTIKSKVTPHHPSTISKGHEHTKSVAEGLGQLRGVVDTLKSTAVSGSAAQAVNDALKGSPQTGTAISGSAAQAVNDALNSPPPKGFSVSGKASQTIENALKKNKSTINGNSAAVVNEALKGSAPQKGAVISGSSAAAVNEALKGSAPKKGAVISGIATGILNDILKKNSSILNGSAAEYILDALKGSVVSGSASGKLEEVLAKNGGIVAQGQQTAPTREVLPPEEGVDGKPTEADLRWAIEQSLTGEFVKGDKPITNNERARWMEVAKEMSAKDPEMSADKIRQALFDQMIAAKSRYPNAAEILPLPKGSDGKPTSDDLRWAINEAFRGNVSLDRPATENEIQRWMSVAGKMRDKDMNLDQIRQALFDQVARAQSR